MKRIFFISLVIFSCHFLYAQESMNLVTEETKFTPSEKTIFYRLSDKKIPLKVQQYGSRTDIVFINLHDDEYTSVNAAKRILETEGGTLIEIENELKRNIQFRLGGNYYRVDPNRIFSREGIEKSLTELGRSSVKAIDEVEKFGKRILQLLPENALCIIALHNNTPELFSALNYTAGNKKSKESKKVYINPKEDADDFFLTTDAVLYEGLAEKGYNTILQDNKKCTEDGSLSVYLGKKNIRYVNCETEHGKTEHYFKLIQTLLTSLPK